MMARFIILRRAKLGFDESETDDAGSNTRLEMHLLSKAESQPASGEKVVLKDHLVCRLHQQQIIEVLLVAVAGSWVLSRLYSFALFLRGSGTFWRLIKAFRSIVTRPAGVRVSSQPQPDSAASFNKELKQYILANRRKFQTGASNPRQHHWVNNLDPQRESDAENANKGFLQFSQDLDDFFVMWNGCWWDATIAHHCTGLDCCPEGCAQSRRRLIETGLKILFRISLSSRKDKQERNTYKEVRKNI